MPKISINQINNKINKFEKKFKDGKRWYIVLAVVVAANSLAIVKILTTI